MEDLLSTLFAPTMLAPTVLTVAVVTVAIATVVFFVFRRQASFDAAINAGQSETNRSEAQVRLKELIAEGEGEELEFKSSLRWDVRRGKVNKELETSVIKTIAAFANKSGGILLIGIDDAKQPVGLDSDYQTLREANRDQFQLHLTHIMMAALGKSFVAGCVEVTFPQVEETEICHIAVKKSPDPVTASIRNSRKGKYQSIFYVRVGNLTIQMKGQERRQYKRNRFD